MAGVDINNELTVKHPKLSCLFCGKEFEGGKFYESGSRHAMLRVDAMGKTRSILCKSCTQALYDYLYKIFRNKQKALYQLCGALDIYYDEELYKNIDKVDVTKIVESYMILLAGDIKYSSKTFIDSVGANVKETKVQAPSDEELTEEDQKNRREIINIFHYDPFENEPVKRRRKLYIDLSCMCDETLRDDLVRQRGALEIVRSFARIDQWTETINDISSDPQKMISRAKDLKTLVDAKAKETDMITKFSKDNGFAERYATAKSKGTGTLSAIMRDMEDYEYDDGKVNRYDIQTSESMQQVADISMASIMKQIGFSEADYMDMLKVQREEFVKLQQAHTRLQEELRLVYKEIKKDELLKELATELIKKGLSEDEVAQAILAEIHYDDEIIKKAKQGG